MASLTANELQIENEKLKAKLDATLRQLQEYEANGGIIRQLLQKM